MSAALGWDAVPGDRAAVPSSDIAQSAQAMLAGWRPEQPVMAPGNTVHRIALDQHPERRGGSIDQPDAEIVRMRLVEHALVAPSPLIKALMRTDEFAVSMLEQLGSIGDQPLFVRVSYHLVGDFEATARRLRTPSQEGATMTTEESFRLHFGVDLLANDVSVEAVRSDRRTATAMRVPVGAPMILRQMLLTDEHGWVRELSFTHFRADRVTLE